METLKSPLLTEPEAAKYLRISARSLWTLRKQMKIRAGSIGRKVFYARESLDRFIAESERSGPAREIR